MDEHIERAVKAFRDELKNRGLTSDLTDEALVACVTAAIEAWDHGGSTLLSDFPQSDGGLTWHRNEDGSLEWDRVALPIRPLSDGY